MARFDRKTAQFLVVGSILATTWFVNAAAGADPAHVKQLADTKVCQSCDLSDAALAGWNLAKADLSGANLSGASLYGANLSQASLMGANLSGADLRAANLLGAKNADLRNTTSDNRTTCPDGKKGPCK